MERLRFARPPAAASAAAVSPGAWRSRSVFWMLFWLWSNILGTAWALREIDTEVIPTLASDVLTAIGGEPGVLNAVMGAAVQRDAALFRACIAAGIMALAITVFAVRRGASPRLVWASRMINVAMIATGVWACRVIVDTVNAASGDIHGLLSIVSGNAG
jgi:hypothetical protein